MPDDLVSVGARLPLHGGRRSATGPSYLRFAAVVTLIVSADLGSKAWIEHALRSRRAIVVIPEHLTLILKSNAAGSLGMLGEGHPRLPLLFVATAATGVATIAIYSRLSPRQRGLIWCLPLILGGALANSVDRWVRSAVLDFIDYRADWILSFSRWLARYAPGVVVTDHYATFNVADVSICAGLAGLVVSSVLARRQRVPSTR